MNVLAVIPGGVDPTVVVQILGGAGFMVNAVAACQDDAISRVRTELAKSGVELAGPGVESIVAPATGIQSTPADSGELVTVDAAELEKLAAAVVFHGGPASSEESVIAAALRILNATDAPPPSGGETPDETENAASDDESGKDERESEGTSDDDDTSGGTAGDEADGADAERDGDSTGGL